jgi:preprotein translocase subunit SecA
VLSQRPTPQELPRGLDAAWATAAGVTKRLAVRPGRFLARARKVLALEKDHADLSDAKLRETAETLRERFRRGRESAADVERGFALVREVAVRVLGQKHYPVQIAGALALDAKCVVEMATGEGKTLTATMPATLGGWRGRGCHVVTVNDYLAKRDAEALRAVYEFCGLRVAHVDGEMPAPDRRDAYQADVTYCTNKEAAADFLRDRLALGRVSGLPEALLAHITEGAGSGTDRLVQRGLEYAIVDEADSVLIDEAVTPLIISGQAPNPEQVEAFAQASEIAATLTVRKDYRVNPRYREVKLTDAGKARVQALADGFGGIWTGRRRSEEMVVQALTARELYLLDKQYVVQEDKVVIVDEFTGRLMPDREWRDGLHQAVAAKEQLEVEGAKDTYARISFQRFFRGYRKMCGMTGTAAESARELWLIYGLPVVVIPTNRPCIRKMLRDKVYATEQAKWSAIVREIRGIHDTGRPILVGTRSVRASEHLGEMLAAEGMACQILNAVRHAEEAQIVAGAGAAGTITVATNMAGRGTDIKLGRGVAEMGGLHVIATERHEAGRVDRQLFGRCSRQGDPGTAQAVVSMEDELVRRHAPHLSAFLRRRHGRTQRDLSSASSRRLFRSAQNRAERHALQQRKGVLRTDDWMDEYLGFSGKES